MGHATADLVASALVPDSFPDEGMDWLSHAAPQRNHAEADLALLSRVGRCNPLSLEEYKATGGFAGLRKAIELGSDKTLAEVTLAGIVGRGGAAFPPMRNVMLSATPTNRNRAPSRIVW